MIVPRDLINPLALVACKQRVGDEDANDIALPVLIHFDAAKRGQCTAAGCNFLTSHLIIAAFLASATRSKAFHECVDRAYQALMKAASRPTDTLDLTTSEYSALRAAFSLYLRALPSVEVGVLSRACAHSAKVMNAN